MPKNTKKKTIKEQFQEALELPKELLKNYSRITVIGGEDVWIENYQGILAYEEGYLRLSNHIEIYGNHLTVEEIGEEDIFVMGEIKRIEFE